MQTILNGGDVVAAVADEARRVLFTGGFVSVGLLLPFGLIALAIVHFAILKSEPTAVD